MVKEDLTQAASFDPDDHTAGGYLDDKDCTIIESKIVEFDYQGQAEQPICAWCVTFRPDGGDEDGEDDRAEYFSVGPLTKFTPSSDGSRAIAVAPGAKINNKSKSSLFARSLKAAGVQLGQDVSAITGLRVHVNMLPMPAFKGKDGVEVKDKSFTAVTALLDGDAPAAGASKPKAKKASGGKKAAAATATATPATEAAGGGDDEEAAVEVVLALLAEKGTLTKGALAPAIFKAEKDAKKRNAIIRIASNAEWLGAEERPWAFDGSELSMGE